MPSAAAATACVDALDRAVDALHDLDAGKVRSIGASNYSAMRLKAALDASKAAHLPHYTVLQPEYNLISRKDFETSIERKVDLVIPYDQKLTAQAAKLGKPLAEVAKATKVGTMLLDLANRLVATVEGEGAAAAKGGSSKSLLGKIGDIKSMLPTKKKEKQG